MVEALIGLAGSVIVGVLALVGTYIANQKAAALMAYRIEQLEKKVEKHNNLVERTYRLEEEQEVEKEKFKVINHRIDDLEAYHKPK